MMGRAGTATRGAATGPGAVATRAPPMAGMAAPRCCACPMKGKTHAKERIQSVRRIAMPRNPSKGVYTPHCIRRGLRLQRFFALKQRVILLAFSEPRRLCYNRRAVNHTGNQESAPAATRGAVVEQSGQSAQVAREASASRQEDASRYCPICSKRLESRRCKLICNVCGYYMSCADYY